MIRHVVLYGIFDGTSHLMLDQLQRRLAQLAGRGQSTGEDWIDVMRRIYTTPPRRLIEASRQRARPHVPPVAEVARALAGLSGKVGLEPLTEVAEALVAVVRGLRENGRWEADQGLRFAGAEILAGLEALLALVELADPDRRAGLGIPTHADRGERSARQPLVYRYALGWYGARMVNQLRQLALVGGGHATDGSGRRRTRPPR